MHGADLGLDAFDPLVQSVDGDLDLGELLVQEIDPVGEAAGFQLAYLDLGFEGFALCLDVLEATADAGC